MLLANVKLDVDMILNYTTKTLANDDRVKL